MTSGSAQPADDQLSPSSTTPTDGPPSEPSTTDEQIPVSLEDLKSALGEVFQAGWKLARMLTQEFPPEIDFLVTLDEANQQLMVEPVVRKL